MHSNINGITFSNASVCGIHSSSEEKEKCIWVLNQYATTSN
jgi:hypothetical protein